ncbi:ROK family protein [Modestobacter sp. VKM Ac-2986]|uniref:ROK family protein n=1 Tax=Modestobacter sp. VKM Ac-2986 TaxID=3004140 RepID=UPI0022AB7CD6|nr:ROK family protein [Modestobacter sp. VKM Ac-2986]MCZ2830595.1 ROK family protein [Modestobacter sp. VKM Ac-2986]
MTGAPPAEVAAIAVDVGGTTVKGALVDAAGRPLHELAAPTSPADGTPVADVLTAVLAGLAGRAAASGLRVVGAGVVTPGTVDETTGRVGFAANLGWRDFDLRTHLEQRVAVPVAVGHDVRAAGAAEALLGAGRGARDLAFVALGTGIAAALVTGGAVVSGATRAAGEIGHMPVHPGGRPCTCGQVGCLEAYASGAAVARRYAELGGRPGSTAGDVAAALGTDPAADRAWQEAVQALALASSTLTMALDPALLVFGGGLGRAGERLLAPLRWELAGLLAWRAAPRLAAAELGQDAGRVGAAMLAYRAAGHGAVVERWTTGDVLGRRATSPGPTTVPPAARRVREES